MSLSLERLVRNQFLFREVNERIREVTEGFSIVRSADFVCECSRADCRETVELDLDEYQGIRSTPTVFVIVRGHELPEIDNVIRTNDRFTLVETTRAVELPRPEGSAS